MWQWPTRIGKGKKETKEFPTFPSRKRQNRYNMSTCQAPAPK